MPRKSYVAEAVLSPSNWDELKSTGRTKLTREVLQQGGAISRVEFKNEKHMNDYKNKIMAGKPFVLSRAKMHDIKDQSGGSMLPLGGALGLPSFKSIGRSLKKGITKVGDEMKDTAFKVNHALKSNPVARNVVKSVAPELAKEVGQLATQGALMYMGAPPEVAKALSKPVGVGAKAGVATSLKQEGYGIPESGQSGSGVPESATWGVGGRREYLKAITRGSGDNGKGVHNTRLLRGGSFKPLGAGIRPYI